MSSLDPCQNSSGVGGNDFIDVDSQQQDDEQGPSKRTRRHTSSVWTVFVKFKDAKGEDKAKCGRCKKIFVGDSIKGTSHLRSHITRCTGSQTDISQQMIKASKKIADDTINIETFKFDQKRSRRDLAIMIVKHNYAFNMVEHEFF